MPCVLLIKSAGTYDQMQDVKSTYKTERGPGGSAGGIRARFERMAQEQEEVSFD